MPFQHQKLLFKSSFYLYTHPIPTWTPSPWWLWALGGNAWLCFCPWATGCYPDKKWDLCIPGRQEKEALLTLFSKLTLHLRVERHLQNVLWRELVRMTVDSFEPLWFPSLPQEAGHSPMACVCVFGKEKMSDSGCSLERKKRTDKILKIKGF